MTSHPYENNDQALRLARIFDAAEAPYVDAEALTAFAVYLNAHLALPCAVVAAEVFDWEEPFLEPDADGDAYERLKAEQPAHTDTFDLIAVNEVPDPIDGLMARVQRHEDGRQFTVPLENLEAQDPDSHDFILLKDYVVWHILQG